MRKIGIVFGAVNDVPDAEYIELMSALGFEATFSDIMEDRSRQNKLAELFRQKGISYEFIHSSFSHINDMWLAGENGDAMYQTLRDEITRAAELGVPTVVVHLSSGYTPPSVSDIGRARYTSLVEHAADCGVKIAFENLRRLGNVAWAMDEFENAENVGFCWDCGHENCYTQGIEFMPLFGKRLICTHIHDNRGIKSCDDHMLPFDGTIDFNRYGEHIRASGYSGTLMLEVFKLKRFGENSSLYGDISSEEFLKRGADAAKRLRNIVDGK